MLNPVTEVEKGIFTAKVQTQKAVDELLSEAIENEYVGILDIWPTFEMKKEQFVFIMHSKKVLSSMQKLSNTDAARYQLFPDKTVKKLF